MVLVKFLFRTQIGNFSSETTPLNKTGEKICPPRLRKNMSSNAAFRKVFTGHKSMLNAVLCCLRCTSIATDVNADNC